VGFFRIENGVQPPADYALHQLSLTAADLGLPDHFGQVFEDKRVVFRLTQIASLHFSDLCIVFDLTALGEFDTRWINSCSKACQNLRNMIENVPHVLSY
jgi:hypothetical protein